MTATNRKVRTMKTLTLMTLIAMAPGAALSAQETRPQPQQEAPSQEGQTSAATRIEAAMGAAVEAGLPVSILESKVAEGEAKRVPPERIAAAVEARLEALIEASDAMTRAGVESASAGELSVTADAIQAGAETNALIRLLGGASSEHRAVATAVFTQLVQLGHESGPALLRVNSALGQGASALLDLQAEVASMIRLNSVTTGAGAGLRAGASGAVGVTGR